MDWTTRIESENRSIDLPWSKKAAISLSIKREDLIHEEVSGNKWRKLRYHMLEAIGTPNCRGLVTKGGAYSNHILATASAAHSSGLSSVGFIRGELTEPLNPTLSRAEELGMELIYVDRTSHRDSIDDLANRYRLSEGWKKIPEGGSDHLGVKGCTEILTEKDKIDFNFLCVSFGTGGTAAGLVKSLGIKQELIVIPALKGLDIEKHIRDLIPEDWDNVKSKIIVKDGYHFGGYAKIDENLIEFMRSFEGDTGIALDPIYTGKMMYGIKEMVQKGDFSPGTRILAVHTGGLQGRAGMGKRLGIDFSSR